MSRAPRSPRALARPLVVALVALTLLVTAALPLATPASAREAVVERSSDTYLCTGYAGCEAAGYSHFGYRENSGRMYWRMYSGHNCVNYVAYRLIQAGMSDQRPWTGSGNATNWGYAMSSITDSRPAVGAVAWWRANVPGAGSAGHVAYVQQVVSPTEIIVSEDSWGGDFHWRRISTSGSWPTGFIHFADTASTLRATTPPVITGTPKVGRPLAVTQGTWQPQVARVDRQWSVDGVPVAGATGRSFTPRPEDAGRQVSASVTGFKSGWESTAAHAAARETVRRGRFATSAPTVLGTARVGETLAVSPADAAPAPAQRRIRWFADGRFVPGGVRARLRVTEAQRGARITARVELRGPGYLRRRVTSAPTVAVVGPEIEVTSPARLEGAPVVGETLQVENGSFAPRRARARYTWLRDGVRMFRQRQASYEVRARDVGARISVRVDLAQRGYEGVSQALVLAGTVRSTPELTAAAVGLRGRAVVRLDLRAAGVPAPAGQAVVRVGRRSAVVDVVEGAARVVLPGLAPGPRRVWVRWRGSDLVLPGRAQTSVEILDARTSTAAADPGAANGAPAATGVAAD